MNTIDLNNIPVEPTVTVLNPDGSELITTNNITTFTYIRSEIKTKQLGGFKVRVEDGRIYNISKSGKIFDEYLCWPEGLPGDVYDELLCKII